MRYVLVVLLAVFVFVGLVGLSAIAQEKSTAPAGEGKVINDKCPVTGEAISADTPHKVEYQGQTIGFCCPECIPMFEANQEKYMEKITISKPFTIRCPKCGADINVKEECMKQGKKCPMMEKMGSATEGHAMQMENMGSVGQAMEQKCSDMESHEGHMH